LANIRPNTTTETNKIRFPDIIVLLWSHGHEATYDGRYSV
jgi:hypothetical protein